MEEPTKTAEHMLESENTQQPQVTEPTTQQNATSTESTVEEINVVHESSNESKYGLKSMDADFIYDIMSIPTASRVEYRMVTYIILWARKNNIEYEFDDYGNVYLTKGSLEEGEFYPCVTSHLDTVQDKAKPYAQAGVRLDIKTRETTTKKHELYVTGMGIGADDKAGVAICLSMFAHIDKLKACFFLEEEVGCVGSKKLNKDWFSNVGYVIGFDSPDRNRAAYSCSGTLLFDQTFFTTYMQDVCKEHGVTDFRSEPFTDVKEIREATSIVCMNFGNGGYLAHSSTEYCVLEDMDAACTMGIALVNRIGNTEHKLKTSSIRSYYDDKEEEFYAKVSGRTFTARTSYGSSYNYGGYNNNNNNNNSYYNSGSTYHSNYTPSYAPSSTTATQQTIEKSKYDYEQIAYIIDVYEVQAEIIKSNVEKKCKELGIDFNAFKDIFSTTIAF